MKAVIYSRVSTIIQDNERQIQELREYAKYKKMDMVGVFEEKISGVIKASNRLEFQRLLEFIDSKKITQILVWELSRLGRSMLDVLNTIEFLSNKKINIYVKKEGLNTLDDKGNKSTMTNMLISILSGFSELERETFKQRSISGIRHNVANGGSGTGIIMAYGYKKHNKKLIVDPEEKKIVELIYNKYLGGLGTMQIANYLNNQGIKTRFNKIYGIKQLKQKHGILKTGTDYTWRDGTIYRILTNSIYIGQRKHKGEIFQIEPMISEDIFNKVQKRLKENFNKKDIHRKYENILNDILICGKCGRSYFMHKREGGKDNAYKCISKRYQEFCGNPSINIDKLTTAIKIATAPIITAVNQVNPKLKKSIDTEIENKQILINNYREEIKSINKKIERLVLMNLENQINKSYFSKLNTEYNSDLNKATTNLEKSQTELEGLLKLKKPLNVNTEELYTEEIFKANIKQVVKSIYVYSANKLDRTIYTNPQDVGVILKVTPIITDLDKIPPILITQRTNHFAFLDDGKIKVLHENLLSDFSFESFVETHFTPALRKKYFAKLKTKGKPGAKTVKLEK